MKHKNFSYAKFGYIFCIPFVVVFLIFSLYPLVYTISISFTDRAGAPRPDSEYSISTTKVVNADGTETEKLDPFKNFKWVLQANGFQNGVKTTFKIWLMNFIPQILLSIILAAWFTSRWSKIKGQGLFKIMFYMPNIITAGTIAVLFGAFFMFPQGIVNDTMVALGFFEKPIDFRVAGQAQQAIVAFIQFWMWYGYTMLLIISGILGLNPEMYESADIDGASPVKQFFYITLPNLRTILLFVLVTSLIGGLNMFDIPFMFLNGGTSTATATTSIFIYNQAFSGAYKYNTAAAASIIMFLIIAVFSAVLFYVMRDKDEANLKKIKKQERRELKKAEVK